MTVNDTSCIKVSDTKICSSVFAPPSGVGGLYFYHPDHLGTSTFLTDYNGNAYQFFLNLPFGETMAEQLGSNYYNTSYKFNGKELDEETGLYYYGARYYDPRTSIWLSVDPLAEKAPNENPFIYCSDNPLKYIDPDGRFKTKFGAWLHKTFNGGGSDTRQNSKTKEFYYTRFSTVTKEDGGGISITPVYGKKETSIFKITNGVSFWGDKPDGDSTGHKGTTTESIESSEIPNIGGSAGKMCESSGLGKIIDFVKNLLEGFSSADGVKDRVEKIETIAKAKKEDIITKEVRNTKDSVETNTYYGGYLLEQEKRAKKDGK